MSERNLLKELDELLKQHARENFSRSLSARFLDKYIVLGVDLDILMILPKMLREDLLLLNSERSKQIIIDLCISEYFEKALLGYKTLEGMPRLFTGLSADEIWSIRPYKNEYLIHVYFFHLLSVFLKVSQERYRLMNILMSSQNEMVLDLAAKAIRIARVKFVNSMDSSGAPAEDLKNLVNAPEHSCSEKGENEPSVEKNRQSSKYFVDSLSLTRNSKNIKL